MVEDSGMVLGCLARIRFVVLVTTMFSQYAAFAEDHLIVEQMVVILIDDVRVPASQAGVIGEISAREGNRVSKGQVLGKLDDRRAQLQRSLAASRLKVTEEELHADLSAQLAEKGLAQQQQLAKQSDLSLEIATEKADNETKILAAQKSESVAKNELDRAVRARQQYLDAVSRSEIDGLRLTYERSQLETRQATIDQSLNQLQAQAERESNDSHRIGIEHAKIEVKQATANRKVKEVQIESQQKELDLAALLVVNHQFVSPFDGVVAEKLKSVGDWVTQGEAVLRVIRLDRLRAEGYVPADRLKLLREQRDVKLSITLGDEKVRRDGRITFISPEVDAVNNQVRFWVEFENPEWDVLPGMRASLDSP